MKFLHSGKVKDVYDLQDGTLMFRFSDRVSAYDVKFTETIPRKGEALCGFAQHWFENLPVTSHYIKRLSSNEMLVQKLDMIPLECVVRGYLYGSLMKRYERGETSLPKDADPSLASRLPYPVFDPTTKSEHDEPINRESAIRSRLLTGHQYDILHKLSVDIYDMMSDALDRLGFILADLKLEFGLVDGQIVLGDSIGPDEYRLWPKDRYVVGRQQESYDKQILRDWLAATNWPERFEQCRRRGLAINPPDIPSDIISQMSRRYVSSYRMVSGKPL